MEMKRILSLMLCAAMLLSCFAAAAEETQQPETVKLESRVFPIVSANPNFKAEVRLYFTGDAKDLPFVDLDDYLVLLNQMDATTDFTGGMDKDGSAFEIMYTPTQSTVTFSLESNTLHFSNFDSFAINPAKSPLDSMGATGVNAKGEAELFARVSDRMMDRPGNMRSICLDDYMIPVIKQDGKVYLPLHTIFDLTYGLRFSIGVYFNGEKVIVANPGSFLKGAKDPLTGENVLTKTELGEIYYSAAPTLRSEALTWYGFGELCMELDFFYGLKDAHNIESFMELLLNTNYYTRLLDPDPALADAALADLISYYMDDLHSKFESNSWMTGADTKLQTSGYGYSTTADSMFQDKYDKAIAQYAPNGRPIYQEIGDTAYVTCDHFDFDDLDYYNLNLDNPDCVQDTVSLILYVNRQVQRPNSPIKNVVIDLSNNSGGKLDAAIFMIGWFLKGVPITNVSTFTGAQGTSLYRVDTNLDREFTDEDYLAGRYNLYCLISPLSFSCGNLVPWVFKTSGLVTLLGDTSGGGSCVVQPMNTAWGTDFCISGFHRLAFVKNGSFYDVDRGVEPDVVLTKLESFYNREKLTKIIKELN